MTDMRTDITIASLGGKTPRIHPSAFIAPGRSSVTVATAPAMLVVTVLVVTVGSVMATGPSFLQSSAFQCGASPPNDIRGGGAG